MPDGTISLYGSNLKLVLATVSPTPFLSKNVLATLNATTFQITDATNKTVTFEFLDLAVGTTTLTAGDIGYLVQFDDGYGRHGPRQHRCRHQRRQLRLHCRACCPTARSPCTASG